MVESIVFVNNNGWIDDIGFEDNQAKITFTLDMKKALRLPLRDKENLNHDLAVSVVAYLANKYGTENMGIFDRT